MVFNISPTGGSSAFKAFPMIPTDGNSIRTVSVNFDGSGNWGLGDGTYVNIDQNGAVHLLSDISELDPTPTSIATTVSNWSTSNYSEICVTPAGHAVAVGANSTNGLRYRVIQDIAGTPSVGSVGTISATTTQLAIKAIFPLSDTSVGVIYSERPAGTDNLEFVRITDITGSPTVSTPQTIVSGYGSAASVVATFLSASTAAVLYRNGTDYELVAVTSLSGTISVSTATVVGTTSGATQLGNTANWEYNNPLAAISSDAVLVCTQKVNVSNDPISIQYFDGLSGGSISTIRAESQYTDANLIFDTGMRYTTVTVNPDVVCLIGTNLSGSGDSRRFIGKLSGLADAASVEPTLDAIGFNSTLGDLLATPNNWAIANGVILGGAGNDWLRIS